MKLNWAERWVVNNPLRALQQRVQIRLLKRMMPLEPGFTALEIGCGRGAGAGLVMQEFGPSWVHATDFDTEMLIKARDYLPPAKRERITLSAADASCLPIKSGSIDAVFGFGVIHHILDWNSSLVEIARVLKPGGAYFLEELYPALYQNFITKHILLHPAKDRFTGQEFRRALALAGFTLKDAIECRKLGILGVAIKGRDGSAPQPAPAP